MLSSGPAWPLRFDRVAGAIGHRPLTRARRTAVHRSAPHIGRVYQQASRGDLGRRPERLLPAV